jgi:hypothetical protein
VRELAGRAGIDPVELVRATGGNPFLVVETVAAGGGLPASVRDAALARAGRLGREARAVVDLAAVIGTRIPSGLLESLRPGAEAVEEALARGVLVDRDGTLGFRHELIREAVESSISPPRRAELHREVLGALEQRPERVDSARLAHHASTDAGQPADTPAAPTPDSAAANTRPPRVDAAGSPVSPLQILQHLDIQSLVRDDLLQLRVLSLQRLLPGGLRLGHRTELQPPPIKRLTVIPNRFHNCGIVYP